MRHGLSVFLILLLPGLVSAQVTLAWKLVPGDRFVLDETVQARQTIKVMNTETRQDLDQVRRSRISVLKKSPDGSLVLEQKIESVKVQHGGDGPDANTKVLKQLEGASFWYHLDPKGNIKRVEGYDALVKQLAKDNRADAKLIRAVLTEESFKRGVETWLGFAPREAVDKGKTWQSKSSLPLGPLGAMALDKTCTLADFDLETQLAKITLTGRGSYQPPPEDNDRPFKTGPGQVRLLKYDGTISFNAAKGRLVQLEIRLSLEGRFAALEISQAQTLTIKCGPANP